MKKNIILTLFLSIVTLLILIGFVFIYSSSSIYALEKRGSAHYYIQKQLIGLFVGIIGFFCCAFIHRAWLRKLIPWFFLSTLLLTGLTLIPAFNSTVNGSNRWFVLAGFMIQPSEILKIAFILYIAFFLAKKQHQISSFSRCYLPMLCIIGLTASVLIKQPDFGQAITLTVTAFILLFIADIRIRYLAATIIPLIPITGLLIFLKPYRFKRILTFLNPWNDRQGAGFQIIQSLIAIGSGGLIGVGIGNSRQKFFYLPMQHTDFIFSIIAEETGFLGAFTIIFLFCMLLYTGFRLALQAKHLFATLTIIGFTVLINLQAMVNIGVSTGLLPTKGIGLPFISYGNASLVSSLCMVGFIVHCIKEDYA